MAALCRSLRVPALHLMKKQLAASNTAVRWLNLQEYQSKQLMEDSGVNVQRFRMASNAQEADVAATEVMEFAKYLVVKAQILAGGRGKGTFDNGYQGGVKLTYDPKEVAPMAEQMIGHKLETKQTPPGGVMVQKLMIAEALDIERETYFAILMDRDAGGVVMVGSPEGGMDIEEVAERFPDKIYKEVIDCEVGVTEEQCKKMAAFLEFKGPQLDEAVRQIQRLNEMFNKVDAVQVEINPFGETPDGRVVCFDAKINFDDNAQFRQKDIFALDDMSETDPREVEASKADLNYIGMDGNIGCMVNGAGLAMATMDIVQLHGGQPANFLDCGGGVTEEMVEKAFKILTSDKQVEAILVNIFGGIVDCATIANGITKAGKSIHLQIPLVVRLEGMNQDKAKQILANSGLDIVSADTFEDAAKKVVASLK